MYYMTPLKMKTDASFTICKEAIIPQKKLLIKEVHRKQMFRISYT